MQVSCGYCAAHVELRQVSPDGWRAFDESDIPHACAPLGRAAGPLPHAGSHPIAGSCNAVTAVVNPVLASLSAQVRRRGRRCALCRRELIPVAQGRELLLRCADPACRFRLPVSDETIGATLRGVRAKCPTCARAVAVRWQDGQRFIACSRHPTCDYRESVSSAVARLGPLPVHQSTARRALSAGSTPIRRRRTAAFTGIDPGDILSATRAICDRLTSDLVQSHRFRVRVDLQDQGRRRVPVISTVPEDEPGIGFTNQPRGTLFFDRSDSEASVLARLQSWGRVS